MQLPKIAGEYRYNYNLSQLTWFKVGGPSEIFFKPLDSNDLANFIAQNQQSLSITLLGAGSNTIIRDGGIDGIVVFVDRPQRRHRRGRAGGRGRCRPVRHAPAPFLSNDPVVPSRAEEQTTVPPPQPSRPSPTSPSPSPTSTPARPGTPRSSASSPSSTRTPARSATSCTPSAAPCSACTASPTSSASEPFDERRPGLDHIAFGCASRDELVDWAARSTSWASPTARSSTPATAPGSRSATPTTSPSSCSPRRPDATQTPEPQIGHGWLPTWQPLRMARTGCRRTTAA